MIHQSDVEGKMTKALLAAAMAAGLLVSGPALAQRPAALVEDVSGGAVAGVQLMDTLPVGKTITLTAKQTLVLSYLASCTNETITGGTVTIGGRESTVEGGKVERAALPCDGGALLLAANESGKAGVTVMRDAPIGLPGAKPKAQITLYKTRPMIVVGAPGRVTFEPLDGGAEPVSVNVPGKAIDLAKGKTALKPGALYKVSAGAKSYVVKVDPAAKDGGGPALGRLIRF